ncbi:hypothetical protein OCU04_012515 [Sclerotinia nivalis]|uniref:Uncharacterized protein n=1 Tax=Sclerotinia nivalis TaxID=352851 RepID=A0A9X0DD11_9HELO|nr:hypothetical protein OCU04_012515 [Sclerotinia nivalis]
MVNTNTTTMATANMTPQPEIVLNARMLEVCEDFLSKNPTFPKNNTYLGHVLSLTLVVLSRVKFFDENQLLTFMGMTYLPYLLREQKNNPLSPYELWQGLGLCDSGKIDYKSNANQMLNFHGNTPFNHAFQAHLEENCKFVFNLCRKGPRGYQYGKLDLVPVPNL